METYFKQGTHFASRRAFLAALHDWYMTTNEDEVGNGRKSGGQNRNYWMTVEVHGLVTTVIAGMTRDNVRALIDHGDHPWSLRPTRPYTDKNGVFQPLGNPSSRKVYVGDQPLPMYVKATRGCVFPEHV